MSNQIEEAKAAQRKKRKDRVAPVLKSTPEPEVVETPPDSWPAPLEPEAYHGLAGEFVRAIEPHTEADPVALLVSFLIAAGNAFKRTAHAVADGSRHYTNEYAVIVGQSSKSRKGTSWNRTNEVMSPAASDWSRRVLSGLSSGEGLIFHVRDEDNDTEDPGEPDKRLMLVESEFAGVLKQTERHGNNLSAVVRDAWDKDRLSPLTKNSRISATNAHVSIIGHITREETSRYLSATESANGFANRFMWFLAKRSKLLPFGGSPNPDDIEAIATRFKSVMRFAALLAVEVAASLSAKAHNTAARSIEAFGNQAARLASNDHMGMFNAAVDGAKESLNEIPIIGKKWAAELNHATAPVRAFSTAMTAFIERGKELAAYNGPLAGANARADIRSLQGEIKESERLGAALARLTDAESQANQQIRELLLPVKELVVNNLAKALETTMTGWEVAKPVLEKIGNFTTDAVETIVDATAKIVDIMTPFGEGFDAVKLYFKETQRGRELDRQLADRNGGISEWLNAVDNLPLNLGGGHGIGMTDPKNAIDRQPAPIFPGWK